MSNDKSKHELGIAETAEILNLSGSADSQERQVLTIWTVLDAIDDAATMASPDVLSLYRLIESETLAFWEEVNLSFDPGPLWETLRLSETAWQLGFEMDNISCAVKTLLLAVEGRAAQKLDNSTAQLMATAELNLATRNLEALFVRAESNWKFAQRQSQAANARNKVYQENRGEYQARVDYYVKSNHSHNRACEFVAQEFKVSKSTVKNHTENKSPQNRGRRKKT
jgi:hypothetical protein